VPFVTENKGMWNKEHGGAKRELDEKKKKAQQRRLSAG
jgi:hypothetical protein